MTIDNLSNTKDFLDKRYNNSYPRWWEMKIEEKIELLAGVLEELLVKENDEKSIH
jgi:hypothetical protein